MGDPAWTRTSTPWAEHDPRPALLSQLRPDLVRIHAAGGCTDQDPLGSPLAGLCPCAGAALEFAGLCPRLQLLVGQHHESGGEMQRVVVRVRRSSSHSWRFFYIFISHTIWYIDHDNTSTVDDHLRMTMPVDGSLVPNFLCSFLFYFFFL